MLGRSGSFEMKVTRFDRWANSSCMLVCSMLPSLLCLGECRRNRCKRRTLVIGLHSGLQSACRCSSWAM